MIGIPFRIYSNKLPIAVRCYEWYSVYKDIGLLVSCFLEIKIS